MYLHNYPPIPHIFFYYCISFVKPAANKLLKPSAGNDEYVTGSTHYIQPSGLPSTHSVDQRYGNCRSPSL